VRAPAHRGCPGLKGSKAVVVVIYIVLIVDWLAPVAGDRFKAACKYCSCILRAHYSDLRHHLKSAKHKRHAKWAQCGGGEPPLSFANAESK